MTEKCMICGRSIDTEHDSHYYCRCGGKIKLLCTACIKKDDICRECGNKMNYHEESITKKTFFNPSTRSGLGF